MSGKTKRKVLLMGMSRAGKTSMRSIIFANLIARDTRRLAPTIGVDQSDVNFMGDLMLNIWDCGAQDNFIETYFTSQKDKIFSSVALMIYVSDIEDKGQMQKDNNTFKSCIDSLSQYSDDASIVVLIHKMDLIPPDQREAVFKQREGQLKQMVGSMKLTCYPTSIWDESLYKAWSSVVRTLVPNVTLLNNYLQKFSQICEADEVVLFERSTFLVVAHASRTRNEDNQLFEQVSTIIKQFKLSCTRSSQGQFNSLHMTQGKFTAFIEEFTSNTFVMVITSDPAVQEAVTMMNIGVARPHFERLIQQQIPIAGW